LGVALDGLGFGDDGTIWGGEFLLADYRGFRRMGSLRPIALPGGSQAVREPWRNLYAHLRAAFGGRSPLMSRWASLAPLQRLRDKPCAQLDRMIDTGLASPLASSTGRLFDAVAAALGICFDRVGYSAQAAMLLEATAARGSFTVAYPFAQTRDAALIHLDPAPMWSALLDDLAAAVPHAEIAARFHLGLAHAIAELAATLAQGHTDTVALSGGCLQNRLMLEHLLARLDALGLRVLTPSEIPANDGGVALGQAVVAAARHLHGGG
jgi:hydrogenase maturation protein HypF